MTTSNGSPGFDLILSKHHVQRIYDLHQQAFQRGLGDAFIDALKIIDRNLRADPIAFGDPRYRLPALKMVVYFRAVYPLTVDYGVNEERRLVFMRTIRLFE